MANTNDKVKANLCRELKLAMKNSVLEIPATDCISSAATQTLCNVIEAIFIHGLRDPFFAKGSRYAKYPEPNFWPFLHRYTHRSILLQIDSLKQIKTEIGKARAWIRIVLNENSLEHYLRLFARDPEGFRLFYHKCAFLRDFENFNVLTGYVKGIAKIKITAPVNSSFLNSWTPTPLILAGLVSGKPARLEQLSSTRRHGSFEDCEADEVGESALDMMELEPAPDLPTSSNPVYKRLYEDDEISSVYSHPSMIENGNARGAVFLYSSTPERNDFLTNRVPENFGYSSESFQVNVRRRKHRMRHFSKSSSDDGSRSRSGSDTNLINSAVQQAVKENRAPSNVLHTQVGGQKPKTSPDELPDLMLKSTCGECSSAGVTMQSESRNEGEELSETSANCSPSDTNTNGKAASVCEDSCDSGVADALPTSSYAECARPRTSSDLHTDDEAAKTEEILKDSCGERGPITIQPQKRDREDSLMSLQDELLLVESPSVGNSLVGKGWAVRSPLPVQQDWEQTSGQSSSIRTNSSHNFDSMIRNVLTGYENDELETSVRCRLNSENFSETFNDEASSGIEIGQASVHENADEGSFIATATFFSASEKKRLERRKSGDLVAIVVGEDEMDGQDEYGISRQLIPLLTKIPCERGLAEQDFRCPSCSKSIGPTFASYKRCGVDGKYYCTNCCRKSDQSIIPSRLIHNWDSRPQIVCKANLTFLRAVEDRPIIRLDKVNPKLYEHCATMKKILGLREKLALAAMYLLSCRQSVAEDLRLRLWPKEYLFNDIHLYSLSDFQCVLSGQLEGHLNSIIRYAVNHIFHCKLCVQKGFLCEICGSREVIYPFQVETTIRCTACYSVYHKQCFGNDKCRKCARRERYTENSSSLGDHLILD